MLGPRKLVRILEFDGCKESDFGTTEERHDIYAVRSKLLSAALNLSTLVLQETERNRAEKVA